MLSVYKVDGVRVKTWVTKYITSIVGYHRTIGSQEWITAIEVIEITSLASGSVIERFLRRSMKETNTHGVTEGTQREPSVQCDNKEAPSLSSKPVCFARLLGVFTDFLCLKYEVSLTCDYAAVAVLYSLSYLKGSSRLCSSLAVKAVLWSSPQHLPSIWKHQNPPFSSKTSPR